jgi:RNA polymerase sigma-70 factor (ECF subfamily)
MDRRGRRAEKILPNTIDAPPPPQPYGWEALPRPPMAELPLTRASLLVRLRDAQDESAWTEFVDLYGPLVYRYLRGQNLQDADAADLCQDVLAAVAVAVNRLDYDRQRGAFRNWLFTIVRRKLWQWRVRQAHRPRGSGDPAIQHLLEHCADAEEGESVWEAEWQRRVFAWACEQVRPLVSATTWQAFWRTAVDGQSGKAVAAELGLSLAAVYLARGRVFARLKEHIDSVQEP